VLLEKKMDGKLKYHRYLHDCCPQFLAPPPGERPWIPLLFAEDSEAGSFVLQGWGLSAMRYNIERGELKGVSTSSATSGTGMR